jgi:uncharacterized protein (TIGR03083 family)
MSIVDSVAEVISQLGAATGDLVAGLAGLTDEQARGPSLLPGWTRGHVLTHLQRRRRDPAALAEMMYSYIMLRTQISLTAEERRMLDAAAARTGRSLSALIRDAVTAVYGGERSADDDLAAMRRAFGSWRERDLDGAAWVDQLRSGSRLDRHES